MPVFIYNDGFCCHFSNRFTGKIFKKEVIANEDCQL